MSAAFSPSSPFMVMQRPLGSTTAFSIDSLIGGPPQPSPGHFVYTGYPMFMPYRSVVLPPPPPPPSAQQLSQPPGLQQQSMPAAHHPHHHHPLPSLSQSSFCSSLAAQGMALTSTLMASLPGGFSAAAAAAAASQHQQQHHEAAAAARKFGSSRSSLHAVFEKSQELRAAAAAAAEGDEGKECAPPLQGFHDADGSTGKHRAEARLVPPRVLLL